MNLYDIDWYSIMTHCDTLWSDQINTLATVSATYCLSCDYCVFIALENIIREAFRLQMLNDILKGEINFAESSPPGTFSIHWPTLRQIVNMQGILSHIESCSREWDLDLSFDP